MAFSLEKILSQTKDSTNRLATIFLAGVIPLAGCSVPQSYTQRMGWESKEREDKGNTYRESLNKEFLEDGINQPKNTWRVLNYMMNFLAEGKAKIPTKGESTRAYLEQLKSLNVVDDSAQVIGIYNKIFAEEDKNWSNSVNSNSFIRDVLMKRLDQVLNYNGFDTQGRLNEWGKLITRLGPFELISRGDSYIVGVFQDGLTYKAEETKDFSYQITDVAQGKLDLSKAPTDKFEDKNSNGGRTADISKAETSTLKLKNEHTYNVPTDYPELDIREIKFTSIPSPEGGVWTGSTKGLVNAEWNKNRLIIDLYANLNGFEKIDSAGKKILPISLEYRITQIGSSMADSSLLVESKVHNLFYDVTDAGFKDGFNTRVITDPIPENQSYQVEVKINNGKKTHIKKAIIESFPGMYPLEITSGIMQSGLPSFSINPVNKEDSLKIFFAVDGLISTKDSMYEGKAYVLLLDSKRRSGNVSIDRKLDVNWDTSDSSRAPSTIMDPKKVYGSNFITTLNLRSPFPRGFFIYTIALPKNTRGRDTRVLALDIYSNNKNIGSAIKNIQIK